MDANERAEKIVRDIWGYGPGELMPDTKNTIDQLAAQISEAEREADRRNKDAVAIVVRLSREDAYKEGFAAAKAKAASLVTGLDHCDMNGHSCTKYIVERIEALEP